MRAAGQGPSASIGGGGRPSKLARRVFRQAESLAVRYRYPRPTIPLSGRVSELPTVYFLAADFRRPAGGLRVIYRHVDVLNEAGISSAVLHQRPGFRCDWFDNNTRVVDARSVGIGPRDVLVVSELDTDLVASFPRTVRHLVLNQSGHLTWKREPELVSEHYRSSTGLLGMIVVSEHSAELMTYAYPQLAIRRVWNSVDPRLFYPGSAERERTIVYFPRRGRDDARQVLSLLHSRRVLSDWRPQALDGLSQREFAAALRSSQIVLNLSYQEGFGLPALEAMACGNFVVGYHGFGGREFLLPRFSAPIETGDVLAVARAVEQAIIANGEDRDWCTARGMEAAAFVSERYSSEHERDSVLSAYRDLLDRR